MKFTCPCCGYKAVEESAEQCALCNWKSDPYQAMDPDDNAGRNLISLREAQHRFIALNKMVTDFKKDSKWCAFAAPKSESGCESWIIRYFEPHYC
ncbi:hypothetical protein FT643_07930 [Ketobacter sp. MCCC 1A13808]|uniref:CPCC family cysteine-rich protein n=1 Tax=Ketobacter sp. MCCC 1A13808 TaxID=2602738 RepID=UPI000F0FAC4A|nr:CPCC family cysteine-rich protein [Ketobacter sp. MCCC 1A13808]MVF12074.1 hypothetical protein [Ketobacter sp. MCCC 1A13808]RLP52843.1 MAG: hypothetical protein D6160_18940 [Ketobacter sp.]